MTHTADGANATEGAVSTEGTVSAENTGSVAAPVDGVPQTEAAPSENTKILADGAAATVDGAGEALAELPPSNVPQQPPSEPPPAAPASETVEGNENHLHDSWRFILLIIIHILTSISAAA